MQYYVWLSDEPKLHEHLKANDGKIRYATTCRDITSQIPQDSVAALSAVASIAIKQLVASEDASIQIWRLNQETGEIERLTKEANRMHLLEMVGWKLYVSEALLVKITVSRQKHLPNETGGSLLGSYDLERKLIYVVDTIFAPKDSIERPGIFIRGKQGLSDDLKSIQEKTLGMIEYIGEWHSHPDGATCMPSRDDMNLSRWLINNMDAAGLPAVMLIACENNGFTWFVNDESAPLIYDLI
jgi:integrative and conjugative element protein (TIGR02256 family)